MTPLTITTDVERNGLASLDLGRLHPSIDTAVGAVGTLDEIGLLRHGTARGRAVVAILVTLPDDTQVLAQTTWALLRGAYAALAASPVVAEEVIDP